MQRLRSRTAFGARGTLVLTLTIAWFNASVIAQGGQATFERLKLLDDQWVGVDPDHAGQPWLATYRVTAAGSVVEETIYTRGRPEMISMYYLDGDHLMLDHYCSLGNQPRMRATPTTGDPNVVTFEFLGITSLRSSMANHDHGLVMSFEDADHVTEDWILRSGSTDYPFTWHFRRARRGEVAWLQATSFVGQRLDSRSGKLALLASLVVVGMCAFVSAAFVRRFSRRRLVH